MKDYEELYYQMMREAIHQRALRHGEEFSRMDFEGAVKSASCLFKEIGSELAAFEGTEGQLGWAEMIHKKIERWTEDNADLTEDE